MASEVSEKYEGEDLEKEAVELMSKDMILENSDQERG